MIPSEQLVRVLAMRIGAIERLAQAAQGKGKFTEAIDDFMAADLHVFCYWRATFEDDWLQMMKAAPPHERAIWMWVKDGQGKFRALQSIEDGGRDSGGA